jgi:hypothetical protein
MVVIRKYTLSIILFIVAIAILIWQFVFPDPFPDLMRDMINQVHQEQIGLKPSIEVLLILYTFSGFISFIAGIVSAVKIFIKNQRL